MKSKVIFTVILMIASISAYSQNSDSLNQSLLDKSQQAAINKMKLIDLQHGWQKGVEYSVRGFGTIGCAGATKYGAHFVIGNRVTEHWYFGAMTGIDITTPWTIDNVGDSELEKEWEIDRKDKIYVPIIGEIRFYFGTAKCMPYLYTDIGAEFSHTSTGLWTLGAGLDINTRKIKSLYIATGFGFGGYETTDDDWVQASKSEALEDYGQTGAFTFTFRLGFMF